MTPTLQSGMHPDADTLTAFAEQLLPLTEREQVLAHAAVCGRCREVIFLAQQAAAEEPVMSAGRRDEPARAKHSWGWWGGWRWAWVPVGALAVMIGVVTLLHFRRAETETQVARNTSPSEPLKQTPPGPPSGSSQPERQEMNAPAKTRPQSARDRQDIQQNEEALDQKGKAKPREPAVGSATQSISLFPGIAGGSIHGALGARAQSTPYDGPMANQLQQNAMQQQNAVQQNAQQQNVLRSAPSFDQKPADNRMAAGQAAASASVTVTVQAETPQAAPGAPPATPPVQLSYVPMSSKSLDVSPVAAAQLKKAAKIALPDGAPALSVASAAGRTVALAVSGALFLSEDQGKHWQPIAIQWTGRAVLVRNPQPGKDKVDLLSGVQAVRFELVNDKLQTWKSPDGKTWTAEQTPEK